MSTVKALGEYWHDEIYTNSVKPKYIAIRNAAKGLKANADDDSDVDEIEIENPYKVGLEQLNKGPERCLKGHSLSKCVKTPLMVLDQEDDNRYDQKYGGVCMYKYCKKNDNVERGHTNPVIDYTEETFYACRYDCCHFSVHEECFGGIE